MFFHLIYFHNKPIKNTKEEPTVQWAPSFKNLSLNTKSLCNMNTYNIRPLNITILLILFASIKNLYGKKLAEKTSLQH